MLVFAFICNPQGVFTHWHDRMFVRVTGCSLTSLSFNQLRCVCCLSWIMKQPAAETVEHIYIAFSVHFNMDLFQQLRVFCGFVSFQEVLFRWLDWNELPIKNPKSVSHYWLHYGGSFLTIVRVIWTIVCCFSSSWDQQGKSIYKYYTSEIVYFYFAHLF